MCVPCVCACICEYEPVLFVTVVTGVQTGDGWARPNLSAAITSVQARAGWSVVRGAHRT